MSEVYRHPGEGSDSHGHDYYRAVFAALNEGLCVVEVVSADEPVDVRFVEVNEAFEQLIGLRHLQGKTYRELTPQATISTYWVDTFVRVALTGVPERVVADMTTLGAARQVDAYAFRMGGSSSRRVAVHVSDRSGRRLSEEELEHRSEQFRALIERAPLGVLLVDDEGRLQYVNSVAGSVFDHAPDLIGRAFDVVMHAIWPEALAGTIVGAYRHTLATGAPYHDAELSMDRVDRDVSGYFDWSLDRILLPNGGYGVVCYFSDISVQAEARRVLAASEARYRTVLESLDEGFCVLHVIFDESNVACDYRYLEVNRVFERHTGISDAVGRTMRELVPDIEPFWFDFYGAVALTGEPKRFIDRSEAMGRWFDVYAVRLGEPHERQVAVVFDDITERRRTEEALQESVLRLRHNAYHDALTGLPNRLLLEDRMQLAVAEAARHGRTLAVLFIDLDGFKAINDALGHAGGDAVLEEVARRVQSAMRVSDTLARMHGDEFVVLLPDLSDPTDAGNVAHTLLAAISPPISLQGSAVTVNVSIGVSVFPRDANDPHALLRAADAAMYQAKAAGKNVVRYFGSSVRTASME
jgi:diguanylate cyclase (GGDEF)-like protein/PAS domain S-box-containing protein